MLKEYPVNKPGVQMLQLTKFTLEPGATLANFTVKDQIFCSTTEGVVSVVDHTYGTTKAYAAGNHFAMRKGARLTFFNPGDVNHVAYFYQMIGMEQSVGSRVATEGTGYLVGGAFP